MLINKTNIPWALWYHIAHARKVANDNNRDWKLIAYLSRYDCPMVSIENYLMRYAERLESCK